MTWPAPDPDERYWPWLFADRIWWPANTDSPSHLRLGWRITWRKVGRP